MDERREEIPMRSISGDDKETYNRFTYIVYICLGDNSFIFVGHKIAAVASLLRNDNLQKHPLLKYLD